MNEVRDRFIEFKINVDSLWSNRQCGTAIGTSFTPDPRIYGVRLSINAVTVNSAIQIAAPSGGG